MAKNSSTSTDLTAFAAKELSRFSALLRAEGWAPLALVLLSVAFRLPAFVNARGVNSDAAIVGLQAMHILKGELSPLLFGSGYQTSVDSFVAALFFLPAGPEPLALMLSTFAGHLVLTLLAYVTLKRHLGAGAALVAVLPLVFTPPSVHTYVLHPPRQAALTLAVAAFCALDGASRRKVYGYAFGAALAFIACFADPYALVFLPGAGLLALLAAFDGAPPRVEVVRRLAASAAGALAGALPLALLLRYPGAKHGATDLTARTLEHNLSLLRDPCLPWGLSVQAWTEHAGHWGPWAAPPVVRLVQIAGALVFVSAILFGVAAFALRRVPWEVRRLGLAGAVTALLTVVGFLFSVMVMDLFSTRYLAAIVLSAPFAMAPFVWRAGARTSLAVLSPYLASAALCGWLGLAPWVDGARIVRSDAGTAKDELALERELETRGVQAAMADYWVSYRLTLLYAERIPIVPKNLVEDRYPPYREAFERAKKVAYVFDPERSREDRGSMAEQLAARGVVGKDAERLEIGRLSALVVTRTE